LISSASDALQMRVEKTRLMVEPGAGRNDRLARLVYQFNILTFGCAFASALYHLAHFPRGFPTILFRNTKPLYQNFNPYRGIKTL